MFLCIRDVESGQVDARTFIPRDTNVRIEASLASMAAWDAKRLGGDPDPVKSFNELVNRPENHSWRTPYKG